MRTLRSLIISLGCFWSIAAMAQVPGDVTGDGEVDVSDVQCTVLTSLQPQTPSCLDHAEAADLNCDGTTDVVDVQLQVMVVLNHPNAGIPADKDADGDNVHDDCDNCPNDANPDQADSDSDGIGDLCDTVGPVCGDGNVDSGEECDDGNTTNGDGCDENCLSETTGDYSPGDVIITEIMLNPKHAEDQYAEWFEIRNMSGSALVMHEWVIRDNDGESHQIFDPYFNLTAGSTVIMGRSGNQVVNGGIIPSYVFSDVTFDDDADELVLEAPDGTVVDSVAYNAAFPLVPGRALSLNPSAQDEELNDDPANWCVATMLLSNEDYGTPGYINSSCPPPSTCGNSTVESGEECDDGNTVSGDGCDEYCQAEPTYTCGNDVLEYGEECDDGNTVSGDGCSALCEDESAGTCGNGYLESGEECDDGNYVNGDGCDEYCQIEELCGNGDLDDGEECDDGNPDNGDGCSADCLFENTGPECGNGIAEEGEECDDGNGIDGDACNNDCTFPGPECGNSAVEDGEQCDDGNTSNGDGCDEFCQYEGSGLCLPPCCGDGFLDPENGEACDDGNWDEDDGCDTNCQWETYLNGIRGTITYPGTVNSEDHLHILVYDQQVANPITSSVSPIQTVTVEGNVSFPYDYEINTYPGEKYIAAVLDVGGDASPDFGSEDVSSFEPGAITVTGGEFAEDIDMELGEVIAVGSVSGTITCYFCGIDSSDALYLILSTTEPPNMSIAQSVKVKPISISLGQIDYTIDGVMPGTYWVAGYLDYGDNSPAGPTGDDKSGSLSNSFTVSEGEQVTGKDFSLN